MSGSTKVGIVRLASTIFVVTMPMPSGYINSWRVDFDVLVWPKGDEYFVLIDTKFTPPQHMAAREAEVVGHLWRELHLHNVVDSPTPPEVVEGDPQLMLA